MTDQDDTGKPPMSNGGWTSSRDAWPSSVDESHGLPRPRPNDGLDPSHPLEAPGGGDIDGALDDGLSLSQTPHGVAPVSSEPPDPELQHDGASEVGYRRPPKHAQFKPGVSGNPKGRPKKSRNVDMILANILDEKITLKENGKPRTTSKVEAILRRAVALALNGNPKQLEFIVRFCRENAQPDMFEINVQDQAEIERFLERMSNQRKSPSMDRE